MEPSYLKTYNNGALLKTADKLIERLSDCCICPRRCHVNRLKGERGFCKTGLLPKVCSFMPHHGEEPPISGDCGSGTIFFSNCNMSCCYCQNYEFSQSGQGKELDFETLASFMLKLQALGCHNINLVTPTHIMPQILQSLCLAVKKGLKIPLVYNTSGYELPEIISLLDGIVDIYLADMRYADEGMAVKYSLAPGYPAYNRAAVKEMHRQVATAKINRFGLIEKGLVVRHLVLPEGISGTEKIMEFISREVSIDTYISLMSQYTPCYKASGIKELQRRLAAEEYELALSVMSKNDLHNGWIQEAGGLERFAGTNIKPNI